MRGGSCVTDTTRTHGLQTGTFLIFKFNCSSYSTLQDLPGGQENPDGAPGFSDPGSAEDRCYQHRRADQTPGRPDAAHVRKSPEADGGSDPKYGRAGPGHWQLKFSSASRAQPATTSPTFVVD